MNENDVGISSSFPNKDLLGALIDIVGDEFVLSSDENRKKHSMTTNPYIKTCAIVVYPSLITEIQKIFEIASKFRIQVWPFSRGNNWGYGTKNALEDGAIILILERMNRIIEVNEELAYAVIEPGVSQKQLNDYLKQKKIKLWMDCTDSTPNGSVLGNAIERGYGYTPYGDHFGHLCGLEVVLPSGEVIRTGGEHANAKTWNTHKWGTGPYLEGLFSQSNFGIVVKAGIWLMPEPECFNLFSFEASSEKHLPFIIDSLRELSLEGVIQSHTHMVNDFQMLSLLRQYPYDLLNGEQFLSESAMSQLRAKFHIPYWSMIGGLYGTKDIVRINKVRVKKALSNYGTLSFFDEKKITFVRKFIGFFGHSNTEPNLSFLGRLLKPFISPKPIKVMQLLPEIFDILKGISNESVLVSAYFKSKRLPPICNLNPAQDGCGFMWLAPTFSAKGIEAQRLLNIAKPLYREHGFEFSGCFTLMNSRTFFLLMGIFFDQENSDEKTRALSLYNALVKTTKEAGFIQYRLGITSMDKFMEDFPEMGSILVNIKSILDPENILAPGRYVSRFLRGK